MGNLGVTYTPSIACYKVLLDFLFAIIEFIRYLLQLRQYKRQSVEVSDFRRGRSLRGQILEGWVTFRAHIYGPLNRAMAVLQLCR